jgi:hypothetical protein
MSTQVQNSPSAVVRQELERKQVTMPPMTEDERLNLAAIQTRMFRAQQLRDTKHKELNNKTFIEYYEENEKIANTFVEGKKFDGDVMIASGTVEQKLYAVAAEINRLSLSPQVLAFNTESEEFVSLGQAMTDILFETAKQEEDDEKRLLRQVELLKQGTCIVQEQWVKRWKKVKDPVDKEKIGKFQGQDYKERLELAWSGPERTVLYAPGVYFGNIREIDTKKQPFIFTHKLTSYTEAESRYGKKEEDGSYMWERWQYVPTTRTTKMMLGQSIDNQANTAWTLSEVEDNLVEEIHYYDKFNNEYQILLNGVPMLPSGFPMTAIAPGGEYNIEKQVYQYINAFFVYGRSFVTKVKEQSDILDELLRLLIIKTRKSIHPPYANNTGRVISSRVLMPGRITMGIDAGALRPIGQEGQGVIASEFQMYRLLQENIDEMTVSKQFSGMQGKAGQTATETNILQAQAQKLLSLTIFSAMMLEQKIAYLRLYNCLENYFEPVNTRYSRAQEKIESVFRKTTRKTELGDGEGMGMRQVIPMTGELPDSETIREEELFEGTPEGGPGVKRKTREQLGLPPIKRIYLNPERLKETRIHWYIEIDTKERETSNVQKMLFREELGDIAMLMRMGANPNVEALQTTHAMIWNRPKDKLFKAPIDMAAAQAGAATQGGGEAGGGSVPPPPIPNESAVPMMGME